MTRRNLHPHSRHHNRALRAGLDAARARDVPKVATGFVANILCSETFVSGPAAGADIFRNHRRDAGRRPDHLGAGLQGRPRAQGCHGDTAGFGRSHAVYREGFGCYLDHGDAVADISVPAMTNHRRRCCPRSPDPRVVAPRIRNWPPRSIAPSPNLNSRRSAHQGGRGGQGRSRRRRALRRGLWHRDADPRLLRDQVGDIGADRHSRAQGRADARSARAGRGVAGRRRIRGLRSPSISCCVIPRGSRSAARLQASLGAALEPVNRMKFMESDMAAYAESIALATPPGSAWNYNDGNFIILSHLIRNAAGGQRVRSAALRASGIVRSARHAPRDARVRRAGNPEGSSQMLASARDWARFGMLYLNDGVAGGKRILPEGWVNYSASPTPNAWVGWAPASGPTTATALAPITASSAAGRAMPSSPRARSGNM